MIESRAGYVFYAVVASLLLISPVSVSVDGGPDWRDAAVDSVSGDLILEEVEALEAFGTRDFHIEESREAALHIMDRMQEIGMEVHLQEFTLDGINVSNVVGTLNPGEAGAGLFLFGAHYDSENRYVDNISDAENMTAPGADDNASGVSVMLEVARVLASTDEVKAAIRFVAFGAEETGFDGIGGKAGSEHFVASEIADGVVYDCAVVLDMVGFSEDGESRAMLVHDSEQSTLVDSMSSSAERYGVDITLYPLLGPTLVYSDHASFWEAGIESILVIEQLNLTTKLPVNPYYHTSFDTSDTLSPQQMEEVAKTLVGVIADRTDSGEDSYLTLQMAIVLVCSATTVSLVVLVFRRRKADRR